MVEKARKLPPFYDICARVKGHAELDIAIAPLEGCRRRRATSHERLRDFPSLTAARGGPMFLHNSLSFKLEVPGKGRLQSLCVMAGNVATTVAFFFYCAAGCSRRPRKSEFDFIRFVVRLI
jgi:hypothetical protein